MFVETMKYIYLFSDNGNRENLKTIVDLSLSQIF